MNATAPPPKPAIILATPIDVEESRAQRLQRQQARFKPAIILATPIDVEESRAQRLQRQQARFRDRGG